MKNKILLFGASFSFLVISFSLLVNFYNKSQEEEYTFMAKENSELFVRDYAPRYGSSDAKVFLIEFLDPECESCRMLYPEVKKMLKEFEGKVQLVVRYAPFHGNSKIAVKAIEAARKQGKYWEALGTLFENQPKWGSHHHPRPELIFEFLAELGLDMNKLGEDMKDPQIEKNMEQDIVDLKQLNIRRTPSFFVNGRPLERFGVGYLRSLIQEEVDSNY